MLNFMAIFPLVDNFSSKLIGGSISNLENFIRHPHLRGYSHCLRCVFYNKCGLARRQYLYAEHGTIRESVYVE